MQDIPGVNCDCQWDNNEQSVEDHRSEIIVPDDDVTPNHSTSACESDSQRDMEGDYCSDCGAQLEWKLRLDGVTTLECPSCE